ncbi:MAG: ABC transporter ATP-binding protein, partial [Planctomycetes bacterium]|nr:ABC transporter ATP-binding protein [Planctomycetota bacterium]
IQAQILGLIKQLQVETGTAVMLITHDMGVVAEMADRVVVMRKGRKIEEGTVREIFEAPQHDYTKVLLAAVPRLGAHAAAAEPRQVVDSPARPGDRLLHTRGMSKTFRERGLFVAKAGGTAAMQDVGFDLAAGETLALVGESGSGKTLTSLALLGLLPDQLRVTAGEMLYRRRDGQVVDLAELDEEGFRNLRGPEVSMVFQDASAALNPVHRVGDQLAEALRAGGMTDEAKVQTRVVELLCHVGIPDPERRRRAYPHELSGGQRQRVSLARALALDPELVIADEPTSALDVSVQARVLEVFRELQDRLQFACLFISHDLAVVDSLANRVAVLQHGRLVEVGPRERVLRSPGKDYTRRLIAAVPVPDPVEQRRRRAERGVLLTDES